MLYVVLSIRGMSTVPYYISDDFNKVKEAIKWNKLEWPDYPEVVEDMEDMENGKCTHVQLEDRYEIYTLTRYDLTREFIDANIDTLAEK